MAGNNFVYENTNCKDTMYVHYIIWTHFYDNFLLFLENWKKSLRSYDGNCIFLKER